MDSWIHLLTKKSQHTVFRVCLQIRQRAFISYYMKYGVNMFSEWETDGNFIGKKYFIIMYCKL